MRHPEGSTRLRRFGCSRRLSPRRRWSVRIGYIRKSFFHGREFVSDADLNARARRWIDGEANVRIHGTLKERPADRFEPERPYLTPLAAQPYRSLAAPPEPEVSTTREATPPKIVEVERRPLAEYAKIAGGVS
ncbi:hypothetical protein [Candidatus Palauibacter sp.]|uniref:hypothetical protein n=1 Tax=Candidatus Palauibacter sp. TaxID=3101350 RepID=UPI003C6FC7C6